MLRLFILLAVTGESLSQIPIPKRQVGFVFNGGHADAPVHLDAYMGPLCPYSRQAFPTITQLAAEYGPDKLKLTIHLFPLPYHRNSFLVAMGQHVVDQVTNGNMSYAWMANVYSNLVYFVNSVTADMSENEVKQVLSLVAGHVGVSKSVFMTMMDNQDINMKARIGWKYTCSRGVSGTPTFMVNDVLVNAYSSWTVTDWKTLIDPLLADHSSTAEPVGTHTTNNLQPGLVG